MPAAARGGRREAAGPRTKTSAAAVRPRPKRGAAKVSSRLGGAGRARPPLKVIAGAAAVLAVAAGALWLGTGGRARALADDAGAAATAQLAGAGLRLETIHLQGATPAAQGEILHAAALRQGAPIFTVDLDAVRRRVEQVGWVNRARVIRLWPDTVVIAVDQRPLVAIWEHHGRAVVVATDGTVVDKADPTRFASLPLIVGDGANLAAAAIIPAVAGHPRLMERLEALVRVDDRRWDVRLKGGTIIQLPEADEQAALIRLDQLDGKSRVLDLALARIDLRDPEMVLVRPREGPAPSLASNGV